MNREETAEAIKVMQASVDGAWIEYTEKGGRAPIEWHYTDIPAWHWMTEEYRIKPKPREFFIAIVCSLAIFFAILSHTILLYSKNIIKL